jgi:hypothetical protein
VVLQPLLEVFNAGVKHYGLHNCLNPFENPSERFYNAQLRHVADCQLDPMAIDPQDGCYHEAKVAFNALMRLYHCREKDGANAVPVIASGYLLNVSMDDDFTETKTMPTVGVMSEETMRQVEDLGHFHDQDSLSVRRRRSWLPPRSARCWAP